METTETNFEDLPSEKLLLILREKKLQIEEIEERAKYFNVFYGKTIFWYLSFTVVVNFTI